MVGWWGLQSHFIVKPNLVLRLGWGFDKIGSVTAEILLTLSFCGGVVGGAESFYSQTQHCVEVRLGF